MQRFPGFVVLDPQLAIGKAVCTWFGSENDQAMTKQDLAMNHPSASKQFRVQG